MYCSNVSPTESPLHCRRPKTGVVVSVDVAVLVTVDVAVVEGVVVGVVVVVVVGVVVMVVVTVVDVDVVIVDVCVVVGVVLPGQYPVTPSEKKRWIASFKAIADKLALAVDRPKSTWPAGVHKSSSVSKPIVSLLIRLRFCTSCAHKSGSCAASDTDDSCRKNVPWVPGASLAKHVTFTRFVATQLYKSLLR